jgi:hypothetical protein
VTSSSSRPEAGVRAPVDVVLARAVESIDETTSLPGGTSWEPKWDGYRLLAAVDADRGTTLWSRRGTDLTAAFPDIAAAVDQQVPAGTVVDGEVVVWAGERLDFAALQRRVASPRSAARLAREQPANLVAFLDLRREPFAQRRARLEQLGSMWRPPLTLSPITQDQAVAATWFRDLAAAGIEGLVAKGADQLYRGGQRDWLKVKQRSVLDVVCAAVVGPLDRPSVVVAGLPIDGALKIVGRTVPLSPLAARELARVLTAADPDDHPWPAVVSSATVNGFGANREPVTLTRVQPLVVEVSADVAWSGRSFRHPLRYVRVRPELHPDEVSPPSTTA